MSKSNIKNDDNISVNALTEVFIEKINQLTLENALLKAKLKTIQETEGVEKNA